MQPDVVLLLGRSIWTRGAGAWRRESFEGGPGGAAAAISRLGELLTERPPGGRSLVFEPEGLAHQSLETPKVGRSVFASLARVRSEFPVVGSENLGWGIEEPEATPAGGFSTLLHSELTPGLVRLRDECARGGCRIDAAWSAYTAAVACAKAGIPAGRARFLIILAAEFVAVATRTAGKRSFRAWTGPMSERDWKAFAALIGDSDARSSGSIGDPGMRRGGIAVIAEGEPKRLCPFWGELHASGRVAAVMDFDALASGVARIPRRHPSNLAEAFPRALNLDWYVASALAAGLCAALTLGALDVRARRQIRSEGLDDRARLAALEERISALSRKQREMLLLEREFPGDTDEARRSTHDALVNLAAAIPDAVTLNSLELGLKGGFSIEAVVVGPSFDPAVFRKGLTLAGFEADAHEGWVYDAASGRLTIRGKLGGPRT
jgi:hypothetical protein